jgi:hypothetical protein
MIIQYPHTIAWTTVANSTIDNSGDLVQGGESADQDHECRYEPSEREKFFTDDGGRQIAYTGKIYLPLSAPIFITGTKIEVYDGDQKIVDDEIKRFRKGQLNCVIWV